MTAEYGNWQPPDLPRAACVTTAAQSTRTCEYGFSSQPGVDAARAPDRRNAAGTNPAPHTICQTGGNRVSRQPFTDALYAIIIESCRQIT